MDLALVGVEDVVVPVVRLGEEGAVPGARESHVVVVTPVSEGQVPRILSVMTLSPHYNNSRVPGSSGLIMIC